MISDFSHIPPSDWVAFNARAFAIRSKFPVSPGHTLVVPSRVVDRWEDLTSLELADVWSLVDHVATDLAGEQGYDGLNVGFNDGEAAGQTVPHFHVHVIPRFYGDTPNPAGGVRGVIPNKMDYRKEATQ